KQRRKMDAEKLRNLTDAELVHQQRELSDQLFRLKFQLKMGQTESLNKIRGLRKDVARIHTIMREKQLNIVHPAHAAAPAVTAAPVAKAAPKKTAKAKAATKSKKAKPAGKARKK